MRVIAASNAEIVHYLAVFRRTFRYIAEAGDSEDRVAHVFGGELANVLHNMPGYLRRTEPDGWLDGRVTDFPAKMRASAPEPIATECARIFASDDDLNELGLTADLSNLDLAPPDRLHAYLGVFRDAFITLRGMRNYGGNDKFWLGVDAEWSNAVTELARITAWIARRLQDVPRHLVQWSVFDEQAFLSADCEPPSRIAGLFQQMMADLQGTG